MGSGASTEQHSHVKEHVEGQEGEVVGLQAVADAMGADDRNDCTAEDVLKQLKELCDDADSLPKAELLAKLSPQQAAEVAEEAAEVAEQAAAVAEAAKEEAEEAAAAGDVETAQAMQEAAEAAEQVAEAAAEVAEEAAEQAEE